jgi:hypothetical protein
MGPSENPTSLSPNQERTRRQRRKHPRRRPRTRRCLLKGCENRYRPRRARQHYCSPECQQAARAWARWKAQQRYRATAVGKQRRNGQSRRYRERVRNRKPPGPEAVPEAARVITKNFFSIISVTGRAVTRGLCSAVDPLVSGSARRSADTRGSVSGSESGVGRRRRSSKQRGRGGLGGELARRPESPGSSMARWFPRIDGGVRLA